MSQFAKLLLVLAATGITYATNVWSNTNSDVPVISEADHFDTSYILQDQETHHRISNLNFLMTDADTAVETVASNYSAQDWAPFAGVDVKNITGKNIFWFRFDVLQPQTSDAIWWMLVDWPQIEYLRIHLFDQETGQWQHSNEMGTQFPIAAREVINRSFVFPLNLQKEHPSTVYVELVAQKTVVMPITVWQRDSFAYQEQVGLALVGVLLGGIGAMFLYNLCLFFVLREKAYLYYGIYVSSVIFYLLCTTGFGNYFFWDNAPWWNERAFSTSVGLIFFTAILFGKEFLLIKKYSGWVKNSNNIGLFAWAFLSFNAAFLDHGIVKYFVFPIIGITIIGGFIVPIYLLRRGNEQAKYFIVAWALLLFGTVAFSLVLGGAIQFSYAIYHAHLLSFFIELMLLSYALAGRINQEREQRLKAQDETMRLQKKHNETLEFRVQERTEQLEATMEELEQANKELTKISITDSLTKIHNRRYFDRVFVEEWRRAYRNQISVAVLLLDIDHFKRINDSFGHSVGDQCIRLVATALEQEMKRSGDLVARYGGEEFACILPDTNQKDAEQFAEHCRQIISELGFEYNGLTVQLTTSIGVAARVPLSEDAHRDLIQASDKALYAAKKAGRNCVVTAPYEIGLSSINFHS